MIKITILEDEKNFRENVELLLNNTSDLECIKTYSTVKDFLEDLENISPDIYWVDLNLPDGTGIEVIQHIKKIRPKALCLVCTFIDNETKIFEALKSGASGYLIKTEGNDKILSSIRELYSGGAPMSNQIARKVLSFFTQNQPESSHLFTNLTKREMEILLQLSKGKTYKEISFELFISVETVKKHLQNIYSKLHVNNKTEAVIKFMNFQQSQIGKPTIDTSND